MYALIFNERIVFIGTLDNLLQKFEFNKDREFFEKMDSSRYYKAESHQIGALFNNWYDVRVIRSEDDGLVLKCSGKV